MLRKDAASSEGMMHFRMKVWHEWWLGEELEGDGRDLFQYTTPSFMRRD